MRTEVEIKAWVDDMGALRERVAAKYPHAGSYVKEDVYYRLPGEAGPDATQPDRGDSGRTYGGAIEFRLRVEGGEAIVTAKRKSIVDGVEINDEMEYTVSDAAAFERFADYLGASVFSRKRKTGERYRAGAATIELSHVERLGDFVEIERLVESSEAALVEEADSEVRSLLEGLGVPASKIEPRYYVDMLAALDEE